MDTRIWVCNQGKHNAQGAQMLKRATSLISSYLSGNTLSQQLLSPPLVFEAIKIITSMQEPSANTTSRVLRFKHSDTLLLISKINLSILQTNSVVRMTVCPFFCTLILAEVSAATGMFFI